MKNSALTLFLIIAGLMLSALACSSSKETSAQQSPEKIAQLIDELGLRSEHAPEPVLPDTVPHAFHPQTEVTVENPSLTLVDHLRKVPGIIVDQSGGEIKVRLRGLSGLTEIAEPYTLFVVNGMIMSPRFEDIEQSVDVHDIEKITVIRGNAATSRYGSRGSNGVVEIVTKK